MGLMFVGGSCKWRNCKYMMKSKRVVSLVAHRVVMTICVVKAQQNSVMVVDEKSTVDKCGWRQ